MQSLETLESGSHVVWTIQTPDRNNRWFSGASDVEYNNLISIGDKETKAGAEVGLSIFTDYSRGAETARDEWLFNFNRQELYKNVERLVSTYNAEVARWRRRKHENENLDNFLVYDDGQIKWSSSLKQSLRAGHEAAASKENICNALYRPFTRTNLYFENLLIHRSGRLPWMFPTGSSSENAAIVVTNHSQVPFSAFLTPCIPALDLGGRPSQVFAFYTYDEDGSNRRENITDWALNEFRTHYSDPSITKWDIFHYVYAVLHHPEYRQRYAANLKRELPRIPFVGSVLGAPSLSPAVGDRVGASEGGSPGLQAGDKERAEGASNLPKASAQPQAEHSKQIFRAFADAGKRLADLHVNYEQQPEYPLERAEKGQLNWRVEKMRLSKDKTTLNYNEFLALKGIPPETYEYRLGNRSALEWVIDQYQVSTDKRSGITNDPNRADDPEYILRLIGQVITISLETRKIVKLLPPLDLQPVVASVAQ